MAKLDSEQQRRFNQLVQPFASKPQVLRMKDYVQHGSVSTYEHCVRVARTSYSWACRLPFEIDEKSLVEGALLHDFYLYDWHDRSSSKPHHATRHPLYAADNASREFGLSPRSLSIIVSHMWPLPPTRIPRSVEAWVVCIADKWCSLYETVCLRGRSSQRVQLPQQADSPAGAIPLFPAPARSCDAAASCGTGEGEGNAL